MPGDYKCPGVGKNGTGDAPSTPSTSSKVNKSRASTVGRQSDLRITPIGIGAWAIGGGKWEFAWGAQDDTESIAAIHAGLDHGINWIDLTQSAGRFHSPGSRG